MAAAVAPAGDAAGSGPGAPPLDKTPRVIHVTLPADALTHTSGMYTHVVTRVLHLLWKATNHLLGNGVRVSVRLALTGTGEGHVMYVQPNGYTASKVPNRAAPLPRMTRMALVMDCAAWATVLAQSMELNANRAMAHALPHPPGLPPNIDIPTDAVGTQAADIASSLRDLAGRLLVVAKHMNRVEQVQSQEDVVPPDAMHSQCNPELGALAPRSATWTAPGGDGALATWWQAPYDAAVFKEGAVAHSCAWVVAAPPCAQAMIAAAQQNLDKAKPFPLPSEKAHRPEAGAAVSEERLREERMEWRGFDMSLLAIAPPWTRYALPITSPDDVLRLQKSLDPSPDATKSGRRALGFAEGESSAGFIQTVRTWTARDQEALARASTVPSARARHAYWHVLPAVPAANAAGGAVVFTDENAAALAADPAVETAAVYSVAIVAAAKDACPPATQAVARGLVIKDEDVLYMGHVHPGEQQDEAIHHAVMATLT